jgi:hypothetical protein
MASSSSRGAGLGVIREDLSESRNRSAEECTNVAEQVWERCEDETCVIGILLRRGDFAFRDVLTGECDVE